MPLRFVIEKEAHNKEVAVAPQSAATAHAPAPMPNGDDEAEQRVDDEEESPEMKLREKQWMLHVEGEEAR